MLFKPIRKINDDSTRAAAEEGRRRSEKEKIQKRQEAVKDYYMACQKSCDLTLSGGDNQIGKAVLRLSGIGEELHHLFPFPTIKIGG